MDFVARYLLDFQFDITCLARKKFTTYSTSRNYKEDFVSLSRRQSHMFINTLQIHRENKDGARGQLRGLYIPIIIDAFLRTPFGEIKKETEGYKMTVTAIPDLRYTYCNIISEKIKGMAYMDDLV